MGIQYYVKSREFNISDYKLSFSSNDYYWNIEAKFDVIGNFLLPDKTIYVNFKFANQDSLKNYLVKDDYAKCGNDSKYCSVYRSQINVKLSGDKFFSQKIYNQIIKGEMFFGFSNERLINLKEDIIDIKNKYISGFENRILNSRYDFRFTYSNNYSFNYFPNNSNNYLDVLTSWYIEKNKDNKYSLQRIHFTAPNYNNIEFTPIINFFNLRSDSKNIIKIKNIQSLVEYYLPEKETSYEVKIDQEKNLIKQNKYNNFSISTNGWSNWNDYQLTIKNAGKNKGIFIPYKAYGKIINQILLETNNTSLYINFVNNFHFKKNYLFNKNSNVQFLIQDRKIRLENINLDNYKILEI